MALVFYLYLALSTPVRELHFLWGSFPSSGSRYVFGMLNFRRSLGDWMGCKGIVHVLGTVSGLQAVFVCGSESSASWIPSAPNPPNGFHQITDHCFSESNFSKHPDWVYSFPQHVIPSQACRILKNAFCGHQRSTALQAKSPAFAQHNIVVQIRFVECLLQAKVLH